MAHTAFKSRAANDAAATNYGGLSYWEYLDETALRHEAYFRGKGDHEKADSMLTRTLSESLMGNDGA